jgi:hypothetical protein
MIIMKCVPLQAGVSVRDLGPGKPNAIGIAIPGTFGGWGNDQANVKDEPRVGETRRMKVLMVFISKESCLPSIPNVDTVLPVNRFVREPIAPPARKERKA